MRPTPPSRCSVRSAPRAPAPAARRGLPFTPRRCSSGGSRIASSSTRMRGERAQGVLDELLARLAGRADRRIGDDQAVPRAPIRRRAARRRTGAAAGRGASSGSSDADRHASPFVSRAREIALLEDLLTQVEEGRGQAVLRRRRRGHRQDAPAARVPSANQGSRGLAAGIGRVLRQLAAVSSADRSAQDTRSRFRPATPTR